MRRVLKSMIAVCLLSMALAALATGSERGLNLVAQKNKDGSLSGSLGGNTVNLGEYHALLIGINDYQNVQFAPKLKTPVNDVYNLRDVLIRQYGFTNENVRLLINGDATRAGILSALASYRDAPLNESDNLLIYYAGHGFQHPNTEDGFWIPVDGTPAEDSWISVAEIRRILKKTLAKHTLLVSDSCFSGTLTRSVINLPTTDSFLREVAEKVSYQVITSGGLEPVADGGREGMSLFAYIFVSYLKGQSMAYFTSDKLYTDIAPLVANTTGSQQTPERGKIPGTFDQNGQFIFIRVAHSGIAVPPPVIASVSPAPATVKPAVIDTGRISFLNLSFKPPEDWVVLESKPGQKMKYKHEATKSVINLSSTELSLGDIRKGVSGILKELPESFIEGIRKGDKMFKKAKIRSQKRRTISDFEVSSVDTIHKGIWFRQDVIVDMKKGRIYIFMTWGIERAMSTMENTLEGILASVQRAGQ
ncbi:caspase domain-containing protein [Thermodesulfobacteriota bacterium]